jgi:selenoprotein W-related protein
LQRPRISIEYCPRCGWMLRSAWLAQELLTTFEVELGEVALIPSQQSGTFRILVNDAQVWSRQADGGFPAAAELKRRVRDLIAPGRSLGHGDAGGHGDSAGSSSGEGG